MQIGVKWTQERDELLRAAWSTAASASVVARNMGGFDHTKDGGRNAVISRARRLGLAKRARPDAATEADRREKRRQIAAARARETYALRSGEVSAPQESNAAAETPAHEPLSIPLADLRDFRSTDANQCRFIGSDGAPYLCCATETLPGESYCGHHHGIVYSRLPTMSDNERDRRGAQVRRNLSPAIYKKARNDTEARF